MGGTFLPGTLQEIQTLKVDNKSIPASRRREAKLPQSKGDLPSRFVFCGPQSGFHFGFGGTFVTCDRLTRLLGTLGQGSGPFHAVLVGELRGPTKSQIVRFCAPARRDVLLAGGFQGLGPTFHRSLSSKAAQGPPCVD